jgi:hypothetical protein
MLIIDAPEFDEIEVEEMISERCSEFGSVMREGPRNSDRRIGDSSALIAP